MKRKIVNRRIILSLTAGLVVGLVAMLATVSLVSATPPTQEDLPPGDPQTCGSCHLDIANSWSNSSHAHAFDDKNFQERWTGMSQKGDCLLCHTTNYQSTTGEYAAEGVSCEACHGKITEGHPPEAAPVRDDAAYCGTCHTTSLGEWRLTGHATAGVGCTDCHNPHSQQALFENPDEMCINCHKESMGPYLENIHDQKGIGCVDCHALVIPPEEVPDDGIVPTGHSFTITPATCVACHTDSLHSGFSLPGYENGAKSSTGELNQEANEGTSMQVAHIQTPEEVIQSLASQLETAKAALASRGMALVFQGGVVGLVLGGSTAWIVATNVRRRREEEEEGNHGK